jgi:hypothetical protein
MRRHLLKGATVLLSAGALVSLGMSPASADDGHRHRHGDSNSRDREIQQTVNVLGNGSSVHIDQATIYAGSIRFVVTTSNASNGSAITLFQPKEHKQVDQVLADLAEEFGADPAKGTRDLTADSTVRGLADVVVGTPLEVTEYLAPGTYSLIDIGNQPTGAPLVTTLTVRPAQQNIEQDSDLSSQTTVQATSADRFVAPRHWPSKGTYTFRNTSDTLHFMELQPVKPGTTDRQVSAYFASAGPNSPPPPFMTPGPSVGNDVVSPGEELQVTYDLPRGTYVLLCFVADDVTGMPHAIMGMHKVVVLN